MCVTLTIKEKEATNFESGEWNGSVWKEGALDELKGGKRRGKVI